MHSIMYAEVKKTTECVPNRGQFGASGIHAQNRLIGIASAEEAVDVNSLNFR